MLFSFFFKKISASPRSCIDSMIHGAKNVDVSSRCGIFNLLGAVVGVVFLIKKAAGVVPGGCFASTSALAVIPRCEAPPLPRSDASRIRCATAPPPPPLLPSSRTGQAAKTRGRSFRTGRASHYIALVLPEARRAAPFLCGIALACHRARACALFRQSSWIYSLIDVNTRSGEVRSCMTCAPNHRPPQ